MPNHKHNPTHSMLTLPSISSVWHTVVHTHLHTCLMLRSKIHVFSCALPFFMTLSCQCYQLQTCTQAHIATHSAHTPTPTHIHAHTHAHSHIHTCILTNLMEAITELSPSCWLAIKCFPPSSQSCVSVWLA